MLFTAKEPYLEDDIIKCIHLMSKLKEHGHNKIKRKQIDKFECLVNKISGCKYSFGSFGIHIPFSRHPQNAANNHLNNHSSSAITIPALVIAAAPTAPSITAPSTTKQK